MTFTWIHHSDHETTTISMERNHHGSPVTHKFHELLSPGKIMDSIIWDAEGILITDYFHHGQTITSDNYATLIKNVLAVIKEKRQGKLRHKVLLHQINTPAHKSAVAMVAVNEVGF